MSGTPQQNDYEDWYPILRLLRSNPFGNDEDRYMEYFANKNKKDGFEWAPLKASRVRLLALLIRGISVRRLTDSMFDGKPAVEPIKIIPTEPTRTIPDNESKYPHHYEVGTEDQFAKETQNLWEQLKRMQKDGKTSYELQFHPRRAPPELSEDEHIFAKLNRARKAAVHPGIFLAPSPTSKQRADSAEYKQKYNAWLDSMRKDQRYRSSTIDAALEIIRQHVSGMDQGLEGSGGGVLVFPQFLPALDLLGIAIDDTRKLDAGQLDEIRVENPEAQTSQVEREVEMLAENDDEDEEENEDENENGDDEDDLGGLYWGWAENEYEMPFGAAAFQQGSANGNGEDNDVEMNG